MVPPPKTMRAIHINAFHPPSNPFTTLQPSQIPIPTPQGDQLLIQVTHTSIQQVDLLYARGQHQNNNSKRGYIHPPFTLGLDFAGIVISVPSPTAQTNPAFRPGDPVLGTALGAFAPYLLASPSQLQPQPPNISARDAAASAGGVVSYASVANVADVRAGDVVLVTGVPGGLGVVATQVAVARGARVFALARTEARAVALRTERGLEGVSVLGADGEWVAEVLRRTGGRGVDVVVDHVGVVEDGLRCLRFGGRVVLVGFAGRKGVMERVSVNRILLKGATVVGYRFGESLRRGLDDREAIWKGYLDLLAAGKVRPIVDERRYVGIESIPQAMQDMEDGRLNGKAVVTITKPNTARL